MQLWATVGRFRCRNSLCPRKVFCERLPRVARAYGRQTERASEIVRLIGYVAGGLPGHRLLARLSIATSDDTVLRRVRQEARRDLPGRPIRNLGVDDWAWRKGQEMERFWSMWSSVKLSTSSLTGPRTASRNGSDTIPKS